MKRVAVLGASGYTGAELERLLRRHPSLALDAFMSAREDETPPAVAPGSGRVIERLNWSRVARCQGVFLCTPHGVAAPLARRALDLGLAVVDLSADFRLADPALYQSTYHAPHAAPELLPRAVYGLTEHARDAVAAARLVANPGCYPTSVLLAVKPLLARGLVAKNSTIIADCKSGTSGAGKNPSERTHFANVHENFCAYGVGDHRHGPEIESHAALRDGVRIAFVPHLLPVFRGILSTIYVEPAAGMTAGELHAALRDSYAGEPFVRVYDRGVPELRNVQLTNECHIGVAPCANRVVLVSAIDNLVKGAAGQALQNMNLVLGCEETAGLT